MFIASFSQSILPENADQKKYYMNKVFILINLFYANKLNKIRKIILITISKYGNPKTTPIVRKFVSERFKLLRIMEPKRV
jgi:UDP-glucose 4-epimerase